MQKDGPTPIEAIDPGSLQNQPAGAGGAPATGNLLAWLVFIVLAGCVLLVFLVLPDYVSEQQPEESEPPRALTQTPQPAAQAPVAPEPVTRDTPAPAEQDPDTLRPQAEALLLEVIEQQEAVQRLGVRLWAADEHDQAISSGQAGDEAFRTRSFAEAVHHYRQALHALQELERRAGAVLAEQLRLGAQALDRNQGETAVRHFELAKAIDPHDRQATDGLQRARTIHRLFSLLEEGGNLEAANRLQEAARTYRQAVELDPLSSQARSALDRVTARLSEARFLQLIAEGYALLEARQFEDARTAFRAAGKLSPDSRQPGEGLAKVDRAVREERIESLKVEAEHFERQQEWALAEQSWQQLLALEPGASVAAEGAARARFRKTLLSRLQSYIENPQRLSSPRVAAEARALLEDVASPEGGPGSRVLAKAATLEEMLTLADRPVPIALQSDNETDVTLLRVARLGRFQHHEILLKPGRYTLVGSRPGYRDVRKTLDVTLGMESGSISIRCEETI